MRRYRWLLALGLALALPAVTWADDDDDDCGGSSIVLEWYAIGGGGGFSSGDRFSVEGTAGQAGTLVTSFGDGLSFTPGYWAPLFSRWDDDDDRVALANPDRLIVPLETSMGVLSVAAETPKEFSLAPITPNPTPRNAHISWAVPATAHVRITVHDVQGRTVATVADGEYRPGRHQVTWSNAGPDRASPGIYFVRMQSPVRAFVRRVVIAP